MKIVPDPLTRFERLLTGPLAPTVDLYLAGPCRELIDGSVLRQLAPTVFQVGRTVVVVRHALGLKHAVNCDRLVYLMDDDWRAGIQTSDLPYGYRAKLALVEARAARRFEPMSEVIVTGSEQLAARYRRRFPEKRVEVIWPVWPDPPSRGDDANAARRIACLGSWSHAKDTDLIAKALHRVLEDKDHIEVCLTANNPLHRKLNKYRNLKVVPAMNWAEYACWLREQRFDIGLYPLRDNRFNQARSVNKILEYAQTGAITLVSDVWRSHELSDLDGAFIPVANDTEAWVLALRKAMSDHEERRTVLEQLQRKTARLDASARSRTMWAQTLELDAVPT